MRCRWLWTRTWLWPARRHDLLRRLPLRRHQCGAAVSAQLVPPFVIAPEATGKETGIERGRDPQILRRVDHDRQDVYRHPHEPVLDDLTADQCLRDGAEREDRGIAEGHPGV